MIFEIDDEWSKRSFGGSGVLWNPSDRVGHYTSYLLNHVNIVPNTIYQSDFESSWLDNHKLLNRLG
jgi:hypothetical protein